MLRIKSQISKNERRLSWRCAPQIIKGFGSHALLGSLFVNRRYLRYSSSLFSKDVLSVPYLL
jgi:hypothetical protein